MIALNHSGGNTNKKVIYHASTPLHEMGITIPDKPIAKIRCGATEIPVLVQGKG